MPQAATVDDLRAVERLIGALGEKERKQLAKLVEPELKRIFHSTPGPQAQALESEADILLYGGAAGGGKSALLVGCAAERHASSLILRREGTQLEGLIQFSKQLLGSHAAFVGGHDNTWTFPDKRRLRFAGLNQPDDWRKYAGIGRDFFGFDEAGEFLKEQVFSLIAWLRTINEGQRCRVILASNPPRGGEGEWLFEEFSPWLRDGVPHGELRWAIVVESKTEWVDEPGVYVRNGEEFTALSRTFIAAYVEDNPYLDAKYRARLQGLPEPLRSQLLYGDFNTARHDHEMQVIPSKWIKAAQDRWRPDGYKGMRMTALAADVAQGGQDKFTIAPRYGTWFAPIIARPGIETPDAPSGAGLISMHRRDGAVIVVDVGGGCGGGVVSYLADNEIPATGFNGANASAKRTQDGQLGFVNKRAEAHWRFREALDPGQEGGSPVALPPDSELAADLAAPRWRLTPRGISVESKDDKRDADGTIKKGIRSRLGRSPDRGDAAVMCWSEGQSLAEKKLRGGLSNRTPVVNVAHAKLKRRRG